MKLLIILSLLLTNFPFASAQVQISQLEGLLEVYHPNDTTSLYIGKGAGSLHDTTNVRENTFLGHRAGSSNSTGYSNSFFGYEAGNKSTDGINNSFFGHGAGKSGLISDGNSFFGKDAGYSNVNGGNNSFFGWNAGYNIDGSSNVCLGAFSGPLSTSGNVSKRLYIDVSSSSKPLIYGEFDNRLVQINGELVTGIGGQNNVLLNLNCERPWIFQQHGSGSATALKLTGANSANNNNHFLIDTEGNVGISTDAPAYKLHVNGNAGKPGGGSWSNASDLRLKTNIEEFNLGIEIIKDLHPVSFEYNGKINLPIKTRYVGVVAQELEKVAPFMVGEFLAHNGETYLNVDPSAFDFILINAVKHLQKRLFEQQEQIDKQMTSSAKQAELIAKILSENGELKVHLSELRPAYTTPNM